MIYRTCRLSARKHVPLATAAAHLEHELRRVDIRRESRRAVPFKVGTKDLGLRSDVAVVDRLAAPGEEEESVEAAKEHGAGLVD